MEPPSSLVLSALEFDVVWASERFSRRHVALDVPSPGITHTERTQLVAKAWEGLEQRGLAERGRAGAELAGRLAVLAHPARSVDAWVWADREVRALAAVSGRDAQLGVVDRDEVWLIPARDTSFVEAVISVAGECPAGPGRSVSVPAEVLREAGAEAGGDARMLITALQRRGVVLGQAQELAGMFGRPTVRGQFGAELALRDGRVRRAERVVAFHDNDGGRYVYLSQPSGDRQSWATVTPADNARIAGCVWELVEEL